MKKLCLIAAAVVTASLGGMYSDAEKRILIQEKLNFIYSQVEEMGRVNAKNKCIYKQAQEIVRYKLPEQYNTLKQQIKAALEQIVASQEFVNYHQYSVMLKTPLLGRDNIEVKDMPIVRPDHAFAKKINEILAATIPVALLERIEVLSCFESYLNYKMDLIDSQFMVAKLKALEQEMLAYVATLEN